MCVKPDGFALSKEQGVLLLNKSMECEKALLKPYKEPQMQDRIANF